MSTNVSISETNRWLLRDVFIRVDSDGDGLVSAEDILQFIRNTSQKRGTDKCCLLSTDTEKLVKEFVKLADSDNDERVDVLDFIAAHSIGVGLIPAFQIAKVAEGILHRLSDEDMDELQIAFRNYDFDNDGKLSESEFVSLLRCEFTLSFGRSGDKRNHDVVSIAAQHVAELVFSIVGKRSLTIASFVQIAQDANLIPLQSLRRPLVAKLHQLITDSQLEQIIDAAQTSSSTSAASLLQQTAQFGNDDIAQCICTALKRELIMFDCVGLASDIVKSLLRGHDAVVAVHSDLKQIEQHREVEKSKASITASTTAVANQRALSQSDLGYINHLFHALDTKHDGVVDLEELVAGWSSFLLSDGAHQNKKNASEEDVREAASKFLVLGDLDKDGVFSEREFTSCFTRGLARVPTGAVRRRSSLAARQSLHHQNREGEKRTSSPSIASGSPENVEWLRYLFSYIDRNQNGLISKDELALLLREFLDTHFQNDAARLAEFTGEMMNEINGAAADSEFTFEQFVSAFQRNPDLMRVSADAVRVRIQRTQDELERLLRDEDLRRIAKVFVSLDADDNGVLDFDEVHDELFDVISAQCPEWSTVDIERTVRSIFDAADVNSDGSLSFEEFISTFVTKHHDDYHHRRRSSASQHDHHNHHQNQHSKHHTSDSGGAEEDGVETDNDASVGSSSPRRSGSLREESDFKIRNSSPTIIDDSNSNINDDYHQVARPRHKKEKNRSKRNGNNNANNTNEGVTKRQPMLTGLFIDSRAAHFHRDLTAEEISELKSLFSFMDENGDGQVSAEELERLVSSALRGSPRDDPATVSAIVDSVLAIADTNRDGFVDLREFISAYQQDSQLLDIPIMAAAARREAAERKMQDILCKHDLRDIARVFLMLDKNGDGYLQADELREAIGGQLLRLHPDWTAEKIDEAIATVFAAADENSDGQLSLDEFIESFVQGHYLLPPSAVRDVAGEFSRKLSSDEVAQLVALFNKIDVNGDGTVSLLELEHALMEAVGKETAEVIGSVIMTVADENRDGVLSIQEFLKCYQLDNGLLTVPLSGMSVTTLSHVAERLIPKQGLRRLGRLFHLLDLNQDGLVDVDELAEGLRKYGNQQSNASGAVQDLARAKILSADFDGDGKLSMDEFIASYANAGGDGALILSWEVVNNQCASPKSGPSPSVSPRQSIDASAFRANSLAQHLVYQQQLQQHESNASIPAPRPPREAAPTAANPRSIAAVRKQSPSSSTARFNVSETELDELRKQFDAFDVASTGFLDAKQFRNQYRAMEQFGLPLSERQIDMIFGPVTRDGKIDFNGFCVIMLRRNRL